MQMAVTERIGKGGLNGEPRKEGGRKGEAKKDTDFIEGDKCAFE